MSFARCCGNRRRAIAQQVPLRHSGCESFPRTAGGWAGFHDGFAGDALWAPIIHRRRFGRADMTLFYECAVSESNMMVAYD